MTVADGDCDDSDPENYPGNLEVCDGQDNNCDETVDEGVRQFFYQDADDDGYGNPAVSLEACIRPEGYVEDDGGSAPTDCDDENPESYPGADEICDEEDNDCDDEVDEGVLYTYFRDWDDDGFGDPDDSVDACAPPSDDFITNAEDCDDTDGEIYPGAPERCNEVDDDCDETTDEEGGPPLYRDADEDGFGDPDESINPCDIEPGYVANAFDCDDTDPAINPEAEDSCDGVDNDCDGHVDAEGSDFDGDGISDPCDDVVNLLDLAADSSEWSLDNKYAAPPIRLNDDGETYLGGAGSLRLEVGDVSCDADTVAYWPLGEASREGRTVFDACNEHDGVQEGPLETVDGIYGNSARFDGGSGYIRIEPIGLLSFSVSVWILPEPDESITSIVDGEQCGLIDDWGLRRIEDDRIQIRIGNYGHDDTFIVSNSPVREGVWTHVVLVRDAVNTRVRIYLNGALDIDAASPHNRTVGMSSPTCDSFPNSLGIGGTERGIALGSPSFKGVIDEAQIVGKALSAGRVAELYRSGRDHRIGRTIDLPGLEGLGSLVFNVAGDRPGVYLEAIVGQSAYTNDEPDEDTVGLWHLEEEHGEGAFVLDSSDRRNDLTPVGSLSSPGLMGYAHQYNGSSAYDSLKTLTDVPDGSRPRTIDAWFYSDGNTGKYQPLLSYGTALQNTKLFSFEFGSDFNDRKMVIIGWNHDVYGKSVLDYDHWYHVATTYDGATCQIFINGQLDTSQARSFQTTLNSDGLRVGATQPNDGWHQYFYGLIDEVRLSNVARSPQEIRMVSELEDRSYPITVQFAATLDPTDLIDDTSDTTFDISHRLAEGLVAQWSFDQTSGLSAPSSLGRCGTNCTGTLTQFDDVSSQDVNTSSGWTAEQKKWGEGALMFDGQKNYVDFGDPGDGLLELATNATIEAWVNFRSLPSGNIRTIISKDEGGGSKNKWVFGYANNYGGIGQALVFHINSPSGGIFMGSLPWIPALNTWYHVVVARIGNNFTFYVDGLPAGTAVANRSVPQVNFPVWVGRAEGGFYFNGIIDEVRLYDRALSDSELSANYEAGQLKRALFLNAGEVVFVRESVDGTEYVAQGRVASVDQTSGSVRVEGWRGGSTAPTVGFSSVAEVFKWQRVEVPLPELLEPDHMRITLHFVDGSRQHRVWVDDIGVTLER